MTSERRPSGRRVFRDGAPISLGGRGRRRSKASVALRGAGCGTLRHSAHSLITRGLVPRKWERHMPKEEHTKAAEHHESAAKSHRQAAEHHGKGDHEMGKTHAKQATEHSKTARQHSEDAHGKSHSK
jgi:hypothetical protein